MSSDRSFRRLGLAAGLAVLTLLGGCQVRPLYSESAGTGERLAAVSFAAPKGRVEQVVRNHLVFLSTGGSGPAERPAYNVTLDVTSTASSIIDDEDEDNVSPSGIPVPGRVQVSGTYTLTRISDGQVLKMAKREVVAQMDVSGQGFAKVRAIRDAENRAARELAEFIRAEIAIVLARESQAAWSK